LARHHSKDDADHDTNQGDDISDAEHHGHLLFTSARDLEAKGKILSQVEPAALVQITGAAGTVIAQRKCLTLWLSGAQPAWRSLGLLSLKALKSLGLGSLGLGVVAPCLEGSGELSSISSTMDVVFLPKPRSNKARTTIERTTAAETARRIRKNVVNSEWAICMAVSF
jgi:hypothetical protein